LEEDTKNRRADITARKYYKQIEWSRNEKHELPIRGHNQFEILNVLCINQSQLIKLENHRVYHSNTYGKE
jgi:hypothetical protein